MADTKIQAIRFAKALALVAALMLATGTSARAEIPSMEAPAPKSLMVIACVAGAIGATALAIFSGAVSVVTGSAAAVEVSKPMMLVMLGGCVAGAASETTRQMLSE